MAIFKKIIFLWKRPCVIIVSGEGRLYLKEAIFQTLKPYLRVKKIDNAVLTLNIKKDEIFIFSSGLKNPKETKKFEFLIKKSRLPILVVSHIGEIPLDKEFFSGNREATSEIKKLAQILPDYGFVVANFDDETSRETGKATPANFLTFGLQERSDFRATDINVSLEGTNFKVNYQTDIVPFWLKNIFGKEQIYAALAAVVVGTVKKLNLVEMSQSLRLLKF